MATPRIQGYTSQKNYDYYQEAYTAYMAKEEGAYMRDYVMDQNGRLESLTFTDVDELNVDKFGLSVLTP